MINVKLSIIIVASKIRTVNEKYEKTELKMN